MKTKIFSILAAVLLVLGSLLPTLPQLPVSAKTSQNQQYCC
ncbi:hypothetical protein [Streptococcus equi]|nr:hypothetical protein [Streptococcus equi]